MHAAGSGALWGMARALLAFGLKWEFARRALGLSPEGRVVEKGYRTRAYVHMYTCALFSCIFNIRRTKNPA